MFVYAEPLKRLQGLACCLASWLLFGGEPIASEPFRFAFKEPRNSSYLIHRPDPKGLSASSKPQWIDATPEGRRLPIQFCRRFVLQIAQDTKLEDILVETDAQVYRTLNATTFLLRAPDVWSALETAQRLSGHPRVVACHPVCRQSLGLHGRYSSQPFETYFSFQWYLENRDEATGQSLGLDLNVRSAWPLSQGRDVTIAIVDVGVELDHPDLIAPASNALHRNFFLTSTNGFPQTDDLNHGTAVAGLAAADGDNNIGISGVAPEANLASWVIFGVDGNSSSVGIADSEQLMDMFRQANDTVAVQNHSWGNASSEMLGPSLIERLGISEAVTEGREGRGVIMVHAGGNNRRENFSWIPRHPGGGDSNEDGYASNPDVIAVGAVNERGRAATYSNPGASLLVAAPGGDDDVNLFTTDRQGSLGYNTSLTGDDLSDYGFDETGFVGTSAAAPLISGVAALILAANPNLTIRDVQQILILSSRHFDLDDPDLPRNGAGILVSHNVGFGIPDAGKAVRMATTWVNRPPLHEIDKSTTQSRQIPDDGLDVVIGGDGVPVELQRIGAFGGEGLHPDEPTALLPLVHLGNVIEPIDRDLRDTAALIQRGDIFFRDKIQFAADAGAEFAIIYNNVEGEARLRMGLTDFVPIPAVFISQNDGEALADLLESGEAAEAMLRINATTFEFEVTKPMICEHVGLRVVGEHPNRGDLRMTVRSPAGTLSVMHRVNFDETSWPDSWTFYSTHHFFESSVGTWRVAVSDLKPGNIGSVLAMNLTIRGTPIVDEDRDGLDDDWENRSFGSLAFGPSDDFDRDGLSNIQEQIRLLDPGTSDHSLALDLSLWNDRLLRLSWPSLENQTYEILWSLAPNEPGTVLGSVSGSAFETEWFVPYDSSTKEFFRIKRVTP